jgi:hypothetical protein
MKSPRPNSGKILQHGSGLGAPTMEDVRQRARELAEIDGWAEATEDHWRRAKRELHGGHDFENGSDEHDMQLLVSEHDFVSADPGKHTARLTEGDEHVLEELVAEGMDEALHEQMLQARREQDDEDSGIDDEEAPATR